VDWHQHVHCCLIETADALMLAQVKVAVVRWKVAPGGEGGGGWGCGGRRGGWGLHVGGTHCSMISARPAPCVNKCTINAHLKQPWWQPFCL
jgi:hypothetical protein